MKFKEYLEKLQKFVHENPESLEMNVIYSKDLECLMETRSLLTVKKMQKMMIENIDQIQFV